MERLPAEVAILDLRSEPSGNVSELRVMSYSQLPVLLFGQLEQLP